jgi:hypothetical protein
VRSLCGTDGLWAQIRDYPAQPCSHKPPSDRAPAFAHLWPGSARGALSGLASHPLPVCAAPRPFFAQADSVAGAGWTPSSQ